MKEIYYVKGMSCGHCKMMVENVLNEVEGIKKVEVNLENNTVTVDAREDVTLDIIRQSIENAGFEFGGKKNVDNL